jgi:hypothetical protein
MCGERFLGNIETRDSINRRIQLVSFRGNELQEKAKNSGC